MSAIEIRIGLLRKYREEPTEIETSIWNAEWCDEVDRTKSRPDFQDFRREESWPPELWCGEVEGCYGSKSPQRKTIRQRKIIRLPFPMLQRIEDRLGRSDRMRTREGEHTRDIENTPPLWAEIQ
jgi:hypothetical protein